MSISRALPLLVLTASTALAQAPIAVDFTIDTRRDTATISPYIFGSNGHSDDRDERIAVASYLGTDAPDTGPPAAAYCADRTVKLPSMPKTAWNGWSPKSDNARFQTAEAAGLRAADVPNLKLKWAFGYAGVASVLCHPMPAEASRWSGKRSPSRPACSRQSKSNHNQHDSYSAQSMSLTRPSTPCDAANGNRWAIFSISPASKRRSSGSRAGTFLTITLISYS